MNVILLQNALTKTPQSLSSFSASNLLLWQDFYRFEIKEFDFLCCVFACDDLGVFQILPPLGGDISAACIDQSFDYMRSVNGDEGITRIDNIPEEMLSVFNKNNYQFYEKSDEIVYCKEAIVALRGNKYKSQRSDYNHFIKNNSYEFVGFKEAHAEDCLLLYKSWAKGRAIKNPDDIYCQMLDDNLIVHKRLLSSFKELGYIGKVVFVGGQLAAYTFGISLNNEMFCVYCEIANLDIKGLSTFIFREFCRDQVWRDKFKVNVMDSFEADGLRDAKMHDHPSELLSSYSISKRKN